MTDLKTKGNQVAPAELEAHLASHKHVKDCAVVGISDEKSGEIPKAFVVKAGTCGASDEELRAELHKWVQSTKARYKWLAGGITFLDEIPRSPSGKILRRVLRDQEGHPNRPAKL